MRHTKQKQYITIAISHPGINLQNYTLETLVIYVYVQLCVAKLFLKNCPGNKWEEPFKNSKNDHNEVGSLQKFDNINNCFQKITETQKFFLKFAKSEDREVKARFSLERLEEMKHICQLTSLINNSRLLKPFIEPILMNVNFDNCRPIFLEFLKTVFQFGDFFTVKSKFPHQRKNAFKH